MRYNKYPGQSYHFKNLPMYYMLADYPYWRDPKDDNLELIAIFENNGEFDVTEEEATYSVILNFSAS